MSRQSLNLFEQAKAIALCEDALTQLRREIAAGPRRSIDFAVQVIEYLIPRTGGNLATARLRTELAACQALLEKRESDALARNRKPELRLVINSTTRGEA
jgi:hypothetical protein